MNISTLEAWLDRQNQFDRVFNSRPLSLLNAKDRQCIADKIDAALSPENLSCDGELPRAEVNRRFRELTRCADQLRSIDPSVVIYEY
jgi:hypothetical protein